MRAQVADTPETPATVLAERVGSGVDQVVPGECSVALTAVSADRSGGGSIGSAIAPVLLSPYNWAGATQSTRCPVDSRGNRMGAIRTAVKQFDVAPAVASEQRELVEALAQLAATKADAFALEIEKYIAEANTDFNRSLPVESWLDTTKETHAMSSESHDLVIEE